MTGLAAALGAAGEATAAAVAMLADTLFPPEAEAPDAEIVVAAAKEALDAAEQAAAAATATAQVDGTEGQRIDYVAADYATVEAAKDVAAAAAAAVEAEAAQQAAEEEQAAQAAEAMAATSGVAPSPPSPPHSVPY